MLWSAVDSLGIYFWFDINLKEISFILLPWTFFGFFLPAMEERKAAKALSFACHFSQTGTIRFFYCFFGRRFAVLPSIELAPYSYVLWTYEWTFHNFFVDLPCTKTAGVDRNPLSWTFLKNVVLKATFTFTFKPLFCNLPEIRFQSFKIPFKFIYLSWSFSPYTRPHFL